jgi:hypothetical protein
MATRRGMYLLLDFVESAQQQEQQRDQSRVLRDRVHPRPRADYHTVRPGSSRGDSRGRRGSRNDRLTHAALICTFTQGRLH